MITPRTRPSIFIGSSSEGLKVAQHIQVLLDPVCEVEIWSQGVFGLSQGTLESLVLAVERFDFATLVLTADDLTLSRGSERAVARDNVIFELGLFMGSLGRERTFIVHDRNRPPALPSDLAGITAATFEPHSSGNLEAALGAACTKIQRVVERLGVREAQRVLRLTEATATVQSAGAQIQELVHLLARSRKVELDIISAQFGAFIEPSKLAQMRKDLEDLESKLKGA
jgi:hypothetical protein